MISMKFCSLTVGSTVDFQVEANKFILSEVSIVVISRSGIVFNQTHDSPDTESFNFSLTLTKEMAPSSKLLVYYIQQSGEIIYDSIEVEMM
jgi:Alpha-2-macroglobulin bait region domain